MLMASSAYSQNHFESYLDGVLYTKVEKGSGVELVPGYDEMEELEPIVDQYEIDSISRPFKYSGETLKHIYRVEFSKVEQTEDLITAFENLIFIEYAEKMPLYETSIVPDDYDNDHWHLEKIDAIEAWNITKGSPDVTIAIVDNGVRLEHEDLEENIWDNPDPNTIGGTGFYFEDYHGYDVADGNNDPNPPDDLEEGSPFSHGTHCAGIASAVTDNGTGIASIGYQASIMAVKCTPDDSDGRILTHTYEGIDYAMNAGADIISMSFGSNSWSITNEYILQEANNRGILLVASAGNNDEEGSSYPAAHNPVISVGATNSSDERASFSNYGEDVDIMAPGVDIYSTLAETTSNYGEMSGTSMSAPLVAGAASLILADNPDASVDEVKAMLTSGSDDIDSENPDYEGKLGSGRLNAYQSLQVETAIQNQNDEIVHSVYPNPADDQITITLNELTFSSIENISIQNMSGKEHAFSLQQKSEGKLVADISHFPEGMYVLRINLNGKYTNNLFLIER